jgi:hypothetical protein
MGATAILGTYLAIGFALAVFASLFSGHDRVHVAVFLWVALGWPYIVPRAIRSAWNEVKEEK